jgi:hypothetical protein
MGTTVTYNITETGDDGRFYINNYSYSSSPTTYSYDHATDANYILIGPEFDWDGYTYTWSQLWLRFQNVAVPQGATIDSAYLKPYWLSTAEKTFNVSGFDKDNAAQPTTGAEGNHSNHTGASVSWAVTTGAGVKTSPDIKAIVQEITDRAGWSSGNAMMFGIWKPSGSYYSSDTRGIYVYGNSSGNAVAQLEIEYTAGGGGSAKIPVTLFINGMST